MTPEYSSQRRFRLFGVLPISLLLIAIPLTPYIAPEFHETFQGSGVRLSLESSENLVFNEPSEDKNAPRIDPAIVDDLRYKRRMVALDVLERLEIESRQSGNIPISRVELHRLRNALRPLSINRS